MFEGHQAGTVLLSVSSDGPFSFSAKAQDNTVALHDAKKIAKCEAHLMFPSWGGLNARHGSAPDDSFCFTQLGLCRV